MIRRPIVNLDEHSHFRIFGMVVFELKDAEKRATISQLFVDHRDRLQFYLRSLSASEDDARQMAQEAYLRMLRIKRRDFVGNPQAYLYRVARNLVHKLDSGQQIADHTVDGDLDTFEAPEPSPEELAALDVRRREVERVMQELSPKCCAAVMLHWHQGLTQKESPEYAGYKSNGTTQLSILLPFPINNFSQNWINFNCVVNARKPNEYAS